MHAVERYGLKFANEKEAGRPVSSCSARRELRRRTGEPYVPLEEEHDGRYQMWGSRAATEGSWGSASPEGRAPSDTE